MALADEIAVKLGLNATEFKASLKDAGVAIEKLKKEGNPSALDKAFDGLGRKIINMKSLGGALAVALGINFQSIAENIARLWTGVSKEEEEALKRLGDLSDKLFEATKKQRDAALSDEKLYQLKLIERDSLERKIASNRGQNAKEQADAMQLQISLIEKENELLKLGAEIEKKRQDARDDFYKDFDRLLEENNRNEERRAKERMADDLAWWKRQESMTKELHDLKLRALEPDKQLIQLIKEQAALVAKIAKDKRDGADTKPAEIELQKNLNAQEAIRAALVRASAQSEAEITAEKEKQLTIEKNRLASIAGIRGGNQFNDATDEALAELARRNRNKAAAIQGGEGGFGVGQNLEVARLLAEALNAEKELAFRREFKQTVNMLGPDGARANFAGDPLQFDRILAQFTTQQDKSTVLLQSLDDRLQTAGFGRR